MARRSGLVLLTTDYPLTRGGLETYSLRIAAGLPSGNFFAVEATRPEIGPPPQPRPEKIKYRFHAGRARVGAMAWSLPVVWSHFFSGRADSFLHMQWNTALGSWLLRLLGFPIRYTVLAHGTELLDPGRPVVNAVKRLVLGKADAVVAGSEYSATLAADAGARREKTHVIHYGYDPPDSADEPRPPLSDSIRLCCIHRLVPRKGTGLLLEALAGLTQFKWTLDIAGEGEERERLEKLSEKSGLAERVRFHALAEDKKGSFLRNHHLFILPSLSPAQGSGFAEGLGIALLEAQDAGLAILASRSGGIPEAVLDEKTGMLFEAGNAEDLRAKLKYLMEDPGRIEALGKAGPDWVRGKFSWEKTLTRLAKLLNRHANCD